MRDSALRSGAAALVLALAGAAAAEEEVPLGSGEEALRERYGEALREVKVERVRSLHERVAEWMRPAPPDSSDPAQAPAAEPAPPDPHEGQRRLARLVAEGDLRRVEYDLHEGRVYRIRWLLAERFERPLMPGLVARLTARLGPPRYDQTLKANLGSGRVDLRRSGWEREGRALEVRQLQPFAGGSIFVTLSETAALQAIVDAHGAPLPQPESSGDWWRKPRQPRPLTPKERDELLAALDTLVGQIAF